MYICIVAMGFRQVARITLLALQLAVLHGSLAIVQRTPARLPAPVRQSEARHRRVKTNMERESGVQCKLGSNAP